MRDAVFLIFVTAAASLISVPAPARDDKPDATTNERFAEAEAVCASWTVKGNDSFIALQALKIDKVSVAKDFEQLKKDGLASEPFKQAFARFVAEDAKDPPKLPSGKSDAPSVRSLSVEFLVAIWFEWRVMKAKDLDIVLKNASNLIKVRFKSTPDEAKVWVSGVVRGTTTYHRILNSKLTYDIEITKDGYAKYVKKDYAPSDDDKGIEIDLVKSK